MTKIADLIAMWGTDEGKPYKGRLIDLEAYRESPDSLGCMCAQGQVLHFIDGWTPEQLDEAEQYEADMAVSKALNISIAHSALLRIVNDRQDGAPAVVLTDPGKVLGSEWSKVLDFGHYLDGLSHEQWEAARQVAVDAALDAARQGAWEAARKAACKAAWKVAGEAAWKVAGDAAWRAAREAALRAAREAALRAAREAAVDAAWQVAVDAAWQVATATSEIQGAEILRRDGNPFFFLSLFGVASPDDIPARPGDYGLVQNAASF